jgi:hypothetical protein
MMSQFLDSEMSKRIQVTLPDKALADLEKWANDEGRSVSNLASYLLQKALDEARERGTIRDDEGTPPQKLPIR